MKNLKKIWLTVSLALSLFCLSNAHAAFKNSGTFQSNVVEIVTNDLLNDGKFIGLNSVNLTCNTFSGKGYIKSPLIIITAKEFKFEGTIECNGECRIITKKAFNLDMFKRAGSGTFTFEVNENL